MSGKRNELPSLHHFKITFQIWIVALILATVFAPVSRASVTGTISGIVTDPSGGVIPAVTVVAVNTHTGVKETATTDSGGSYSFQALLIGEYEILMQKVGFSEYRQTGLVIDVNSALRVDATL